MFSKPSIDEKSAPPLPSATENFASLSEAGSSELVRIADSHLLMNGLSQVVAALGVENDVPAVFLVADYLREILSLGLETHISLDQEALVFKAYVPLLAHMHGLEIRAELESPAETVTALAPRHVSCDILGTLIAALHSSVAGEFIFCRLQVESAGTDSFRLDVQMTPRSEDEVEIRLATAFAPLLKKGQLAGAPSVHRQEHGTLPRMVLITIRWPLKQHPKL